MSVWLNAFAILIENPRGDEGSFSMHEQEVLTLKICR